MAIADIRKRCKKQIHGAFSIMCEYLATGSLLPPISIPVRVYQDTDSVEAGAVNSSLGWASMSEHSTYLLFSVDDVTPIRGSVVTTVNGQYQIDRVLKAVDGYVPCEVITL
ncbi:MAG: hypothetical protein PF440_10265 [Thiomicrorhabdus sp.]|jgi:hypothetical protein|nr:hypothetical protein [Thiomicrorhabdus sp.]